MKRLLTIILIVLFVAAALLLIPPVRRAVGAPLNKFVSRQIEQVAADFLNPTLSIGQISYTFPFTAAVKDLVLIQDDVKILEIPSGSITIQRIPFSSGQVRFQNFTLESPTLRFVVDEDGDLVGWGDLLKSSEDRETEGDRDAKASDAFAIQNITVTNATIEYQDQRIGENMMSLNQFDLSLNAQKAKDAHSTDATLSQSNGAPGMPAGEGWYRIATTLDRPPLFALDIDAGLDINSGDIVFRSLKMNAKLDRENDRVLPPQIQSIVQDYSVTGEFKAVVKGTIRNDDPLDGPLDLDFFLTNATAGSEGNMLKIQSIEASGTLRDDLLEFNHIDGELIGGKLAADFALLLADRNVPTAPRLETDAEVDASSSSTNDDSSIEPESILGNTAFSIACGIALHEIDLRDLLTQAPDNEQLLGLLDFDLEAAGIVTEWPKTLVGEGQISISKGQLASIPIISALGRAMRAILLEHENNDELQANLELRSDGVVIEDLSVIAGLMAARGRGVIRFNNTIDMIVNGGPMERVQKSLGALGRALGRLTDRIVRYQVTGDLASPSVRVRPLGINTTDPTAPPEPESNNSGSSP